MPHRNRRSLAQFCVLIALVVAFMAWVAVASAAPAPPKLGTAALQQLLVDRGGSVDGYMSTVLKGSTITTIPVEITAVTGGFANGPAELSALILFRAYGPKIDAIGGIASGMSGSPIFVDDGGDKLVGALSYGDSFALNGFGLATPIDAMSAIEGYPMSVTSLRPLFKPVLIGDRVINNIVVTPAPQDFEKAAENGTFVAKPLAAQYVGGLDPRSKMYKAYQKHLEANGASLVPLAYGLSSMEHPYDAEFQPGSAIAALAARGDLWAGGIGTVTYVNGDNVLAFGHPMFYDGASGVFMSNAWIDGVWPSLASPYKMGRPAGLRGTITQDRGAGIMGVDGKMSPEATVTATVTYREDTDKNGSLDYSKVGTSTVELPDYVVNSASWNYEGLAPMAAYLAASHACDSFAMKGSAVTTTTVVVTDGAQTFNIVRANMFEDGYDIAGATMMDVASIVYELQQLGDNGIAHPKIQSVDVVAEITKARRSAEIVGVDVAGGLRTGDNTATVSMLRWGVEATQTVDIPFTIPAGVPLTGDLQASDSSGPDSDADSGYFDEEMYYFAGESGSTVDRRTTAKAVEELGAMRPNNTLVVTYQPMDLQSALEFDDEEDSPSPVKPKTYDPIEVATELDYVVSGGAGKSAPRFNLKIWDTIGRLLNYATLPYGERAEIVGELLGAEGECDIAVSRLYAGTSSASTLSPLTFDPDEEGFSYASPGLSRNAKITFSFAGNDDTLATQGSINVKIRARTLLSASSYRFKKGRTTTLRASVGPTSAKGAVVFERYSRGWWYRIGTRTISGGKASMSYRPSRTGTYKVRARYLPAAGSTNAASNSSSRTLRVVK